MEAIKTFVLFYYYVFKKSPKKYDLVNRNVFGILIIPVGLMFIHMIVSLVVLDKAMWVTFSLVIHILTIPGNLILTNHVRNEGWRIQAKLRKERREYERLQREKQYREYYEHMARMRREREQKERENRRKREQQNREKRIRETVNVLESAYRTLGLTNGVSIEKVKQAFRTLSKKYHPDMPSGDEKKFIEIKNAYDTISKHI